MSLEQELIVEVKKQYSKFRFIGGYQNLYSSKDDFALTPYLGLVCIVEPNYNLNVKELTTYVYGLSLTFGWYSCFLAFALNIPKKYPTFKIYK